MGRRSLLVLPLLLLWLGRGRAEELTFSDAVGVLGQERSYAESGAALLKAYAPGDVEGRASYAQAKAAFDSLIEQLLADLAQHRDPQVSAVFRERLEAAVTKRIAFSEHVDEVLKAKVPQGAKPGLVDALAKAPAELVKELFAGGIAIWHEWGHANADRRREIATRLEAQRWKPFADIAPAA